MLRKENNSSSTTVNASSHGYFELHRFDEIQPLAQQISQLFPDEQNVRLGLTELLLNAFEHGNLGIAFDRKTELLESGMWEDEIKRLQNLPEHADKKVRIEYERDEKAIRVTIKDEGRGFDWHHYLELRPERFTHLHGRGIALARAMSFDNMYYVGCGNEVVCEVFCKNSNNGAAD